MRAILHLTRANLRKGKDLALVFITILAFASMLLLLGIITIRDYKQNIYNRIESLHSPDAIFTAIMNDDEADKFTKGLESDSLTESTYRYPIQYVYSDLIYGQGKMSLNITILPMDVFHNGNDFEVLEEVKDVENPIYLPYIFKDGGGYELYDTFDSIKTEEGEINYQVAGFYDSFMLGSVNNGFVSVALPKVEYDALSVQLNHQKDGYIIGSYINDNEMMDMYTVQHTDVLRGSLAPGVSVNSTTQNVTMSARTISSNIGSYVVVMFSALITVIALLMIRYRIHNSVEENSENIGALKSLGFTNKQIQNATILQFCFIGMIGILLGIALGYLVLPLLAIAYCQQTGLYWNQGFDLISTCITIVFLEGIILITCIFSTRGIKKLSVLQALRFGIATHNFQKNHVPLTKKGPLSMLLGCKLLRHNLAQTIIIFVISLMITFCASFFYCLNYNMTYKPDVVIDSMMGEKADISLYVEGYDKELLKGEIEELPKIEQAIYYTQTEAYYEEHQVMLNVTEDFENLRTKGMLYEGRYPKYADEIAINGLMAAENDIAVGDEIMLGSKGESQIYLVTGYIQSTNYMGYDVSMREDGIKRIQSDFKPGLLYVYGNEMIDNNILKEQLLDTYAAYPTTCTIFDDQIQATMGVFHTMISLFTLVILVISFLIISLILYLMTQTIIVHRTQELGIQKAIGFTTRQLQLQIAISFLPELCFGSITGAMIAFFYMNSICSKLFSSFGWMNTTFSFPFYFVIGIVVIITGLAFLMLMFLTRRIRRISPYALLSE